VLFMPRYGRDKWENLQQRGDGTNKVNTIEREDRRIIMQVICRQRRPQVKWPSSIAVWEDRPHSRSLSSVQFWLWSGPAVQVTTITVEIFWPQLALPLLDHLDIMREIDEVFTWIRGNNKLMCGANRIGKGEAAIIPISIINTSTPEIWGEDARQFM